MPLSTDITLPRERSVQFPDTCVGCRRDHPGDTVRLATDWRGSWLWFTRFGRDRGIEVPVCYECRQKMMMQRFVRGIVCWLFIGAGVYFAGQWVGSTKGLNKLKSIGIVLACMVPWFAWEMFFPRVFDIAVRDDEICYEFRDAEYAKAFAALNNTTID